MRKKVVANDMDMMDIAVGISMKDVEKRALLIKKHYKNVFDRLAKL